VLTAHVVDHSARVQELLDRKIGAAARAAAEVLSASYKNALQSKVSPKHSEPGEIPHAYNGPARGGYRSPESYGNPDGKNNYGQVDFLSDYIDSASSENGTSAVVGFSQAPHVAGRQENYLLDYDQTDRPWTRPVFDDTRAEMKDAAISALKSDQSVPF